MRQNGCVMSLRAACEEKETTKEKEVGLKKKKKKLHSFLTQHAWQAYAMSHAKHIVAVL